MIKIQYKELSNQNFLNGLQHLASQPVSVRVAKQIKNLIDAVMQARKSIGASYMKEILGTFAKKGEDGSISSPDAPYAYDIDPEKKAGFEEAEKAFGERYQEINQPKINLDSLGEIQISASLLAALDPVLEDRSLQLVPQQTDPEALKPTGTDPSESST